MIDEKLQSLGIILPPPEAAAGNYIPVVISGNLAFVSGQIPIVNDVVKYKGKVDNDNIKEGQEAAKICIMNMLSQLKKELGSLDRITKFVKLSGFVNTTSEFTKHSQVINGASDFLFEIFGEKGKHARIAIGVPSLPLDSMTEVDAIIEFA